MKTLNIILISILILLFSFSTYCQEKDFFPLSIGNELHYKYFVEYASYKSPLYPPESHDDYSRDSGEVIYKFIGLTLENDTTRLWTVREIRNLYSFQWHLDSLGIRDTLSYIQVDSSEYSLYEYTTGLHQLSGNMSVFNFSGQVYRYSETDADSIVYILESIPYTFKSNIGLTKILYSYHISGNFSYEDYTKRITLIRNTTKVNTAQNNIRQYYLSQNYPNPFNPITTIEYSIPKTSFVRIKVYDLLGQKILTLVNEEEREGIHRINFNASNLSSGIYFYRIQAGKFTETRKLVLSK